MCGLLPGISTHPESINLTVDRSAEPPRPAAAEPLPVGRVIPPVRCTPDGASALAHGRSAQVRTGSEPKSRACTAPSVRTSTGGGAERPRAAALRTASGTKRKARGAELPGPFVRTLQLCSYFVMTPAITRSPGLRRRSDPGR